MHPRRLVLMRHAKSDRDALDLQGAALADHLRPLAPRGRRAAPAVAAWLRAQGWAPDAVVASDATRAAQTWAAMAPALGPDLPVRSSPGLYLAGLDALRADARAWDPGWTTVLAIGHNPGWELAAGALAGQPVALKTASCALLEGRGATWTLALTGPWRLARLLHPRAIEA